MAYQFRESGISGKRKWHIGREKVAYQVRESGIPGASIWLSDSVNSQQQTDTPGVVGLNPS